MPGAPRCDPTHKLCVGCLVDAHCPAGSVCIANRCAAGCGVGHGCAPDGGVCEADAGACVECNGDGDCRDPRRAFCDKSSHRCFECVDSRDTCAAGKVCVRDASGALSCQPGCRNDGDCAAPVDAGISDDGGAPPLPAVHCQLQTHRCVACLDHPDCPAGRICAGNACVPGCTIGHVCDRGLTCCNPGKGSACVDLTGDPMNCGQCGKACAPGSICCQSACTDPLNDASSCGGCGNACTVAHGAPACRNGKCIIAACDKGWQDCRNGYADGCETNILADPANCGACNRACNIPGGCHQCINGTCPICECLPGWGCCYKDPCMGLNMGCNANLLVDPMHCGKCFNACPNGQQCVNGICK
jgi:Cys-rich repeat protein